MQTTSHRLHRPLLWLTILIFLAAAFAAARFYYAKQNEKPALSGTPVSVERGDVRPFVSATGTISAVNSVDISSKVTGRILEVKVAENDQVKAGQVLVVLDDLSQQTQVRQTRAQALNAQANFDRSRRLAASGAIAQQQLDADRTSFEVSQANYSNALSALSDTIILAPIDGRVIGKPIPAGQTVAPGISNPMVLLTVADMSAMQIQVQVDETDIGKAVVGQKVSFSVDAYPGKIFTGRVSLISQKASVQQNVVYYTVYVSIDEPQGLLFPLMTARVSIWLDERKNVLLLPTGSVRESKGKKYVLRLVDGKEKPTNVNVGLSDDEKIEITAGLSEGDQVIAPGGKNASPAQQPGMRSIFGR